MKTLSILQPWAWAILYAHKTVENRSWRTGYRGPLLIHAGKSDRLVHPTAAWMIMHGIEPPPTCDFGAILGVAELRGCVRALSPPGKFAHAHEAPWADNPYPGEPLFYWLLANPRPFATPIPYRGRQGLFAVTEPEILAQIAAELRRPRPEKRNP